ncbi:PRTRC genetic system protein C [Paraburkholderia bannensis]|uniref:PRTRC genetic system protein C n=1 Tax=Paraburkholderia bannensis TaxID=765414 RepID=A0A7W9WV02_9BURK|nr:MULTISPECIES: PRTRC system protein C [Paraburkholderia]MBB3259973.1 PRTRC genetic system protein C [Paraburkholderia sp. WP4_3_2]MBB6105179.1 PRTRC genetic system protein C [Paraburkholderia bannensis]
MQIETLAREFVYNGARLTDPAPSFTLQQVRDFYANTYPEIVNAEIEGPEVRGNRHVYTFRRAVGTKGKADRVADTLVQAHEILAAGVEISRPLRIYLTELTQEASAHVCPLLEEEFAFVNALHARNTGQAQ